MSSTYGKSSPDILLCSYKPYGLSDHGKTPDRYHSSPKQDPFLFILLERSPWLHIMIIIGWRCSKPRTYTIGTLSSVPLLCYISYHRTPCLQLLPFFSSCTASYLYFSYSPSNADNALSLASYKPIPSCSRHLRETQALGLRTDLSQRSIIGRIEIYCVAVFCLL